MTFQNTAAYSESDADDEYEHASSSTVPGSAPSPMGQSSNEHTPTTYGHRASSDRLPETIISEWTAEECADFTHTIGLHQYADLFIVNEIDGEALVALLHDDLKSMGIMSVGHRLTILKSIYDVKKTQDIPIEIDHYIPLSAEAEAQFTTATLKDIRMLVEQLRLRDERIHLVEQDGRRITDDFKRLREDVLPALRLVKDAQQPLPSTGQSQSFVFDPASSPLAPTPSSTGGANSAGLKRQFSNKKLGSVPVSKTSSPTQAQTNHDRSHDQALDPTGPAERAIASSTHQSAANGSVQITPTLPLFSSPNAASPTSPVASTLGSRSYRGTEPTPARSAFPDNDHTQYANAPGRDKGLSAGARRRETPVPDTPSSSSSSVEIFKSFRVSMDDPCYKVLPAALKKYQINAPWDQYALYIVYGDQERCLGLQEKPLILFKQLDKEGKKPMFMLRKTTAASVDTADISGSTSSSAASRGESLQATTHPQGSYDRQ